MTPHDDNGHDDSLARSLTTALAGDPPADVAARLGDVMRRRWQDLGASSPAAGAPSTKARSIRGWRIAACLALLGGGVAIAIALLVTNGGANTAYAQAIEAVQGARSVHVRGYRGSNGELTLGTEVWYSPTQGVREQSGPDGRRQVRIDDRHHEWIYREGTSTVIKGDTRDSIGVMRKMLSPLHAIDRLKAQPDPKLNARIEGVGAQAFVADARRAEPARHVMWLDPKRRLVRYEEQRRRDGGAWDPVERLDLVYDVPIDTKVFAADFGPDLKLVERSASLAGFEVEGALATAERLGVQLAVHDVRRVEGDTAFVMFTSRPTPEVVKRLGPISDMNGQVLKVYGNLILASGGYRLPNHDWVEGFTPVEVAGWRRDGVEYNWVLIRQASDWLKAGPPYPLGFHVYARAEWEKALAAEGKPTWLWNEQKVVSVDVPNQVEPLDTVLSDVYAQTMSMGDAAGTGMPHLMRKPRPLTPKERDEHVAAGMSRDQLDGQSIQPTVRPEDITLDAWMEEFKAYLAEIDARHEAARTK